MSKVTMPEPVILRTVMPDDYRYGHVYGFTRRQMEAYAAAKVREALGEAERFCRERADEYLKRNLRVQHHQGAGMGAEVCADAIRAMIDEQEAGHG